ncbi:DNA-formamidopyrimidine glycosylase [soil metagenome]
MPELPEVETIRRGLDPHLTGRVIEGVTVETPKQFIGDPRTLANIAITKTDRRGKLLIFELADGRFLTIHLKMTGQLLWKGVKGESVMGGHPSQTYIDELPNKHTRMTFTFTDGSVMYFNDLRKFGFAELMGPDEFKLHGFLGRLGPEPLGTGFNATYLQERLTKAKSTVIKSFLLEQAHIAGIGNIYADESLFRAGIHPERRAGSLSTREVLMLTEAIIDTLQLALKHGGSSERDYVNSIGEKGTYLKVANVYRKTGLPCPRCPDCEIKRIKVGGRSTHFCANCQK